MQGHDRAFIAFILRMGLLAFVKPLKVIVTECLKTELKLKRKYVGSFSIKSF